MNTTNSFDTVEDIVFESEIDYEDGDKVLHDEDDDNIEESALLEEVQELLETVDDLDCNDDGVEYTDALDYIIASEIEDDAELDLVSLDGYIFDIIEDVFQNEEMEESTMMYDEFLFENMDMEVEEGYDDDDCYPDFMTEGRCGSKREGCGSKREGCGSKREGCGSKKEGCGGKSKCNEELEMDESFMDDEFGFNEFECTMESDDFDDNDIEMESSFDDPFDGFII